MFAWRRFTEFGRPAAALAAAATTSMSAWAAAVFLGQYTLPVTALICAMSSALAAGRDRSSGLLLGLAAVKPTLALPFGLLALKPFRWRTVLCAVLFVIGETIAVASWLGQGPVFLIRQWIVASRRYTEGGYGPVEYAMHLGIHPDIASLSVAAVTIGLALVAVRMLPSGAFWPRLGICAVAVRFWSYHLHYDDGILVFPLLGLFHLCFRRGTRTDLWLTTLLSFSLMLPARTNRFVPYQWFQQAIWLAAAGWLWLSARRSPDLWGERARRLRAPGNHEALSA
jgi:hypothetical protein